MKKIVVLGVLYAVFACSLAAQNIEPFTFDVQLAVTVEAEKGEIFVPDT